MKCMKGKNSVMALMALALLAIPIGMPDDAAADMNVVGSTHGQAYQGVANPDGGPAASIPLSLCDVGGPTPDRYQNAANIADLTDPLILMPANTAIVWRCTVNGTPNFLFRYTGGFTGKAYGNMKAALGSTASKFTSIVPGGAGCVAVAGGLKTDPGTGRTYNSFQNCTERVLVPANFGTGDTRGTDFQPSMCDPSSNPPCAQPITDTGITSFPITATPFVVIVGNGVQKCTPGSKVAAGKISLTRVQVEAIFSGQVATWNQLGYCVYPVAPLTPPDSSLGAGAGALSPGAAFNGGINQSIVTCSRPTTAGTRIIYDAVFHKDVPEIAFGTVGPPFVGDFNYLARTVSDGLACVQGRSAAPVSQANMNAIVYNRADEGADPLEFSAGNVGRMRGGYPVPIDGLLPSDYDPPANVLNPSDADRAVSQKEFRCGRYLFWSDWVGIQRTVPDANQALWNEYVAAIGTLLPKTRSGYFWARNVRQPGQTVNTEMFVQKGQTAGPITFNDGDHPACY
ncbi:MAG: hypothetical protein L0H94_00830 [Nitrospira sp.]|nr:hypothetical protein [Nitrospira sp.]